MGARDQMQAKRYFVEYGERDPCYDLMAGDPTLSGTGPPFTAPRYIAQSAERNAEESIKEKGLITQVRTQAAKLLRLCTTFRS